MTRDSWSLRLARPADADHLPAIERAASALFAGDPDLADIDLDDGWTPQELRQLIGKGHCLVAESEGVITGFMVTQPYRRELHIWEMDVHPDAQGRGIGAGLLRACIIDARNCGFAAVTLTTFRDVPWNAPFYAAHRFTEVDNLSAHPRLAAELDDEAAGGLPRERRCAMIRFLD